jgi:hypothetical protein
MLIVWTIELPAPTIRELKIALELKSLDGPQLKRSRTS